MTTETDDVLDAAVTQHDITQVDSLKAQAVRGTYWVVGSYALQNVLRMGSSVILTRFFAPQYFGVMALLTTIYVGLNLFSHIGLQDSIIQNPRGDEPIFLNTAWTIQVVRGIVLFLVTVLLAWPMARFYPDAPQMMLLLPAVGFGCVIAGFSSPSLLTLSRHMGVGRISSLELLTQFIQLVVTVIWAYFQPSIWALVAGRLISELARTIISFMMMPEIRPKFAWDRECINTLVKFGRWILVGTALHFLAQQSDRLIISKMAGFAMLGIYGIAFSLSDLPRQVILQFCSRIGFPFIAKFASKPREEYRAVVLKYRRPILLIGAFLISIVVCTGDKFILHVYDKRYYGAAWMIAILAIGLWHTLLYSTITPAIMSLQKAHYNAYAYLANCVALFVALPLGYKWAGMFGAVVAVAISDLPVYFVNLWSAHRERVGVFTQDVLMTFVFAGILGACLTLRYYLGFGTPFPHLH